MAHYRSFLLPSAQIDPTEVILEARESAHLVRVLRARVGAKVELLDGMGQIYLGVIEIAGPRATRLKLIDCQKVAPHKKSIQLLQSIPKGKTMDLIVRMATEIGVQSILPVFTNHGEVQFSGARCSQKQAKWAWQLVEACKQCGLAYRPRLEAPLALADALADVRPAADELRIVASLEPGSQPLHTCLDQAKMHDAVVIAVGPEGDFSPQEYAQLRLAGFQSVRLGQQVLRAETAVAYLLSVVDQWRQRVEAPAH